MFATKPGPEQMVCVREKEAAGGQTLSDPRLLLLSAGSGAKRKKGQEACANAAQAATCVPRAWTEAAQSEVFRAEGPPRGSL